MDFGLCKSELKSIEIIDNQWLQCETSKERLGQDIVLRRAPFTRQVLPLIDFEKARTTNTRTIASTIKRYRPPRSRTSAYLCKSLQRMRSKRKLRKNNRIKAAVFNEIKSRGPNRPRLFIKHFIGVEWR